MKYLGIDYGTKRIGLAVSDKDGGIAFPRTVIPNDDKAIVALETLLRDELIEHIVIGDARTVSGTENAITGEADAFADALARKCALPVSRVFEAWSSIEASRFAPDPRLHDDAAAAAIILQRFLDMRSSR